jgi:hypothetical protein
MAVGVPTSGTFIASAGDDRSRQAPPARSFSSLRAPAARPRERLRTTGYAAKCSTICGAYHSGHGSLGCSRA